VDLTHSFTVQAPIAETWQAFQDIESVAGCFPGATVTQVFGNDFEGTCKVRLGPIALVYSGSGTFLEKDQDAHRFVVDAKGKDKRGNGTAGARVTATFAEVGDDGTRVDVHTDLSITGKPAQFGRGVIEDISDKLLQQFVTCLQSKVGAADEPAPAGTSTAGTSPPITPPVTPPTPKQVAAEQSPPAAAPVSAPAAAREDVALDLGATVLPVLARAYGPQLGLALVALVVGFVLGRRRR
jgi:carbon monoxide dehydrogenase subunit G